MSTPDITNLSYAELSELRTAVAERMNDMRDTGITQLRATIAEQAELLGVQPADLLPKKPRRKSTKVGAKYRDPNDAHNVWSGRGKPPRWMQALLDQGRSKDEFAIAENAS